MPAAEFCARLTDNSTTLIYFVPSKVGPSTAFNIVLFLPVPRLISDFCWYWQIFGLFTFLSRRPIVNRLSAGGTNLFRTSIMTTIIFFYWFFIFINFFIAFFALSFATLCWAAKCGGRVGGGGGISDCKNTTKTKHTHTQKKKTTHTHTQIR